jgi:hypothetical protein
MSAILVEARKNLRLFLNLIADRQGFSPVWEGETSPHIH